MKTHTTTSEVIDALGGTDALAATLSATPRAVRSWRSAKEFPPKTYIAITAELAKIGQAADVSLWNFISVNEQEAAE
jgi:hypothetical protein